ncbi:translation initiation factor IF-2-like [Panthera pardus]|uniref:Translation initiation factor IF-2-like n=1 Tax=Panthera pardus TaxID=9691 RepID=A0A9W2ULD5_PANPR|nr:translation initiation factor IF-2-like [Panthera pardus]
MIKLPKIKELREHAHPPAGGGGGGGNREEGRGPLRRQPATARPASSLRPQLAPADCGHVTPRANREGPTERGGLLPHHKHGPETAERAAARGPGRPAAARDARRLPNSPTPPSASPAGPHARSWGQPASCRAGWPAVTRGGRHKANEAPPPVPSAGQPGQRPFLKTTPARRPAELGLHFDAGGAARLQKSRPPDDRGGAEPRRAPDTAAGTRPVGAGQPGRRRLPAKLPAEGPPRLLRRYWPGERLRQEGAGAERRGRGCCGRAGRPGCAAGAGRRRPPRLGLTKRKQPSPSTRSPGAGTRPEGSKAAALGPQRERGEKEALPARVPRPGPIPECFEAVDLEGSSASTGLRARPPPTALTPSGCEIRGRRRFFAPQLG